MAKFGQPIPPKARPHMLYDVELRETRKLHVNGVRATSGKDAIERVRAALAKMPDGGRAQWDNVQHDYYKVAEGQRSVPVARSLDNEPDWNWVQD